MNSQELTSQCDVLIQNYWQEFSNGETWNYFIDPYRYTRLDSWATHKDWMSVAERCLKMSTNTIQALEILLVLDKEGYMDRAEQLVAEWSKGGAHDPYKLYVILSHFPLESEIRKEYLGESEYRGFLESDGWGYNRCAREALIGAEEESFLHVVGAWLDSNIVSGVSGHEIEEIYFPVVVEMGNSCNRFLSSECIEILKNHVFEYLQCDRDYVLRLMNGETDEGRSLWIIDSIAFSAWRLGWNDVLNFLTESEWYWVSLFDSDWDDENRNLLAWSSIKKDLIIRSRAEALVRSGNIDGAIAWKRISEK